MVAQGQDVTVFTTTAGIPEEEECVRRGFRVLDGVKINYFKCSCTNPIFSRALTREAEKRAGEFDLMHLVGVWQPSIIGVRRAAVRAGLPYVVAPRGALGPWSLRHKRLKKLLYYRMFERKNVDFAQGILYTSRMELSECSHFARFGQEQQIVPNGIDFSAWIRDPAAGSQWRLESRIASDTFLFLNAGRLHTKKNLHLLIHALGELSERKWHLAFVGKDEDGTATQLQRQADALGVRDRVSFHPTVAEHRLKAVYSAADLFVLPSHHENFCNAALESLACGCPVLISDQVAIGGDLHGIRGVQVRKRDVSAWSDALASAVAGRDGFLTNPADRQELERRFSIKNCASQLIQFHQSVLARSQWRRRECA